MGLVGLNPARSVPGPRRMVSATKSYSTVASKDGPVFSTRGCAITVTSQGNLTDCLNHRLCISKTTIEAVISNLPGILVLREFSIRSFPCEGNDSHSGARSCSSNSVGSSWENRIIRKFLLEELLSV